jgi:hypothetical protein
LKGEEVNVCNINGGREVRTGSADHEIPKKYTDYKATEAEISEPSVMQIIIGNSKSLVQILFSGNLPSSNFESGL